MEESDFGKGCVYCIGLFLAHAERLNDMVERYKEMREKHPDMFEECHAVQLWFNGASDHIYELEIPNQFPEELRERIKIFQSKCLDLSHGISGLMLKVPLREGLWAIQEAKDILREIDRTLGVEVIKGNYE